MAKLDLKGTITRVFPVETVGQNGTKKQSMILTVPAYVDEYGEKRGEDEEWKLDTIGDQIDKHNLTGQNLHGKKAKVTVYLNSKKVTKTNGDIMHIVNVNIAKIEVVPSKDTASSEL